MASRRFLGVVGIVFLSSWVLEFRRNSNNLSFFAGVPSSVEVWLLSEMQQALLLPDQIAYSIGVSTCGKDAKWQLSAALVEKCRQSLCHSWVTFYIFKGA